MLRERRDVKMTGSGTPAERCMELSRQSLGLAAERTEILLAGCTQRLRMEPDAHPETVSHMHTQQDGSSSEYAQHTTYLMSAS